MTRTHIAVLAAACGLVVTGTATAQETAPPTDPAVTPAPVTPPPTTTPAPTPVPKPVKPPKLVRPTPPSAKQAWVATLHRAITVRTAPRNSARKRALVHAIAPFAGGLTRLLVTRSVVKNGEVWVEVLLPLRPNGSRGWVPADQVSLTTTAFRVEINRRNHRLRVYRAGRRVMDAPVAVGTSSTPTPRGRFAIAERIEMNNPGNFLGPIVLPITGYSEVLNEFAGGDGRVAIHGTSAPQLIGTSVSHGCIRMYNRDIVRLARMATPGTPVTITG